jgi:hypothetical protein
MRAPAGKTRATTGLNFKGFSVQPSREDTANHFTVFVLSEMDVARRALPVRRKRSRQMQFLDAVRVSDTTQREPFATVFDLDVSAGALACIIAPYRSFP